MIPSDLLRYKLDNKNNKIFPILCSLGNNSKDLEIATQIIQAFEYCFRNKLIKEKLDQLLKNIELVYKDFKLVRGLSAILERRCTFSSITNRNLTNVKHSNTENSFDHLSDDRNLIPISSPQEITKAYLMNHLDCPLQLTRTRERHLPNVSIGQASRYSLTSYVRDCEKPVS